jgi:membrane protein DedA with SNARE-associated domain
MQARQAGKGAMGRGRGPGRSQPRPGSTGRPGEGLGVRPGMIVQKVRSERQKEKGKKGKAGGRALEEGAIHSSVASAHPTPPPLCYSLRSLEILGEDSLRVKPHLDFFSTVDRIQVFGPHLIYLGIYAMLLLSAMGMPLPEDLTLVATGYLINTGLVHPVPAVAVGILGVLTGDQFVYSVGKHFGARVVRHRWFSRVLPEKRFAWIRELFERHGEKLVFFARFLSGLRGPVFLASGILEMPRGRFLLYDGAGALINVPLFILLGHLAGPHLEAILLHLVKARGAVLVLLGLVACYLAIRVYARRRYGIIPGDEGKN